MGAPIFGDYVKGKTSRVDVLRVSDKETVKQPDLVVLESPLTILLNDVEVVTLLCSPKDLEYLAAGFLFGEGLLDNRKQIKRIFADAKEGAVWVETVEGRKPDEKTLGKRRVTTGCGKGMSFIDAAVERKELNVRSSFTIPVGSISQLMKDLQSRSDIYRKTGGVHSAGIADSNGIVFFNEDIGRHNAVDKVLGERFLKGTRTGRLVLITSGRVSSDIVLKAGRSSIPVIVSKSAPTDLAVELALELGITLVGFARGSRMNIYSNERRILTGRQRRKGKAATHR